MKIILILIGLIPLKTLGQQIIPDSLQYYLTRQSIDNLTIGNVKIFDRVMGHQYLLDKGNRILQDVAYFSKDDIQSIDDQILNSTVRSWDNQILSQENNIEIVKTLTNDECVFISVPLISLDGTTIVIYYEIRRHKKNKKLKSGSGTITVWTKTLLNEWIQQRQQIIWMIE